MKSIIYTATPLNGVIEIPLFSECKCDIGLVSICIQNINHSGLKDDLF